MSVLYALDPPFQYYQLDVCILGDPVSIRIVISMLLLALYLVNIFVFCKCFTSELKHELTV